MSSKHVDPKSSRFILPDLISQCTFTLTSNPHYARCQAESSAWVESFNVFINPRKRLALRLADSELLCAYAYPYADYEALRICCDFVNLLFIIDEISDDQSGSDAKATGDVYLDVLNDRVVPNSELARMSYQFKARILRVFGPHTFKQFVERCTAYLHCVGDEAKLRETRGVLDPQSYAAARRENSAIRTCFALFNMALGVDFSDAVFENPIYERLYFAAVDMICWSNDLYSYNMEQAKTHFGNNILTVLMKAHNVNLQEAADMVGIHIEGLLKQFDEDKHLLKAANPELSEKLKGHIYAMECWAVGNLYWSFHSRRYFGEKHEEIMRTRLVKLSPKEDYDE